MTMKTMLVKDLMKNLVKAEDVPKKVLEILEPPPVQNIEFNRRNFWNRENIHPAIISEDTSIEYPMETIFELGKTTPPFHISMQEHEEIVEMVQTAFDSLGRPELTITVTNGVRTRNIVMDLKLAEEEMQRHRHINDYEDLYFYLRDNGMLPTSSIIR